MSKRYGEETMAAYREKRKGSLETAQIYFKVADLGDYAPIYRFGDNMISDDDIVINKQ